MNGRSLGHRAPLLWLVLPYAGGLVVGKVTGWPLTLGPLAIAFVAAVVAIVASRESKGLWAAALSTAMLLGGLASYTMHRARVITRDALPAREVRLSLKVTRIFAQADARRVTGLGTITKAAEHLRELAGQRIYFSFMLRKGDATPLRSTVVSLVGVLDALPANPPAETFEGYLAGAGINFRLARGRLLAIEQAPLAYYRHCGQAAALFHDILGCGIAEKRPALAGLLRAMMLGATHELSDEQQTLFMQSGTMHLFAISGLNIGVVAGALQTLLLLLRLPPWVRFAIGAVLLWLFVDITGASPSAVRAFVMALFLQAAFVLRLPANVLAALTMSAFCVLLFSPLQLFSASFLMSYAIVTALLALGLPLSETWKTQWSLWRDLPKPAWRWWHRATDFVLRSMATALAIGIATTLVSLMTGVQYFQLLTPASLVTNLVLIPAAVIVTLGGFASLLCGLLGFLPGAIVCNHAAALVLLVIESLVRLSARLPGAFVPARFDPAWLGPATVALLLGALLMGYMTGWKSSHGGWWPPFAIVGYVLIFGMEFGSAG